MSVLARALAAARRGGARELASQLLGATVYRRLLLFDRVVPPPSGQDERWDPPLSRTLLGPGDVGDYVAFRPGSGPEEVLSRLEAGHLCFAVRLDGRIVHAAWAATGRVWIDYLRCTLTLGPDEVYAYDSFTERQSRRLSVARLREQWMARELYARGYRRAFGLVLPENRPALRYHQDDPRNRLLGTIGYVGFDPFRRAFTRPRNGSLPRPEL